MYYLIEVKGWPVLVWLQSPPPERYVVLATYEDVLKAVAGFYDAVERARRLTAMLRASLRRPGYEPGRSKTMSPAPPPAKNRPTYDSPT